METTRQERGSFSRWSRRTDGARAAAATRTRTEIRTTLRGYRTNVMRAVAAHRSHFRKSFGDF